MNVLLRITTQRKCRRRTHIDVADLLRVDGEGVLCAGRVVVVDTQSARSGSAHLGPGGHRLSALRCAVEAETRHTTLCLLLLQSKRSRLTLVASLSRSVALESIVSHISKFEI